MLILFINCPSYAQNKTLDSLNTKLNNTGNDTNRVNILVNISKLVSRTSDYPLAIQYSQKAWSLAQMLRFHKGMADAAYYTGRAYMNMGNYDSAVSYMDTASKYYVLTANKKSLAYVSDYKGIIHYKKGDYPTALHYCNAALELEKINKDASGMISTYNNIGNIYSKTGNYPEALKNYYCAIQISDTSVEKTDKYRAGGTYSNIGIVYFNMDSFDAALKCYDQALKLGEISGDKKAMANNLQSIGNVYKNLGRNTEAMNYYQSSLQIRIKINDRPGIAHAYQNMGDVYYNMEDYTHAAQFMDSALTIKKAVQDQDGLITTYTGLGNLLYKSGQILKAKTYLDSALLMAQQTGNRKNIKDCYAAEMVLDSSLGNGLAALKDFQMEILVRDSLDNEESRNKIALLKQQYEDHRQKLVNEMANKSQTQLMYQFIIGFLLVVMIVGYVVNRWRYDLKIMATKREDTPEIVVRKMTIVILSIATCFAALIWTFMYYYYYGFRLPVLGPVLYFMVVTPAVIIFFINKKEQRLVNVQLFCIFTMPLLMEWSSGGFMAGVVVNWAILAPVGALIYKGMRQAAIWMILFVIVVIFTIIFNNFFAQFYYPIPSIGQSLFYGMNIIAPAIVIYFTMQFFVKTVTRDGQLLHESNLILTSTLGELQLEKQKSDNLLLNILPAQIAEELKQKQESSARLYNNVTVILTDFKNFTAYSEKHSPHDIVSELHACFTAFDDIMGKYGIEKIKTIGDGYLAVCGLPDKNPRHASIMLAAAKEILQFMNKRYNQLGETTFQIRIGIHSGQVVAGIVGIRKFAYDIWGDTVNIAARMEQNSEPGRINISGVTYELVKSEYSCSYRGKIAAKNKGEIDMYFVD